MTMTQAIRYLREIAAWKWEYTGPQEPDRMGISAERNFATIRELARAAIEELEKGD